MHADYSLAGCADREVLAVQVDFVVGEEEDGDDGHLQSRLYAYL